MKRHKLFHTPFREKETKYWKDMDELHWVLHRIPGYFKGVVLELTEKPLSREDIREYVKNFPKLEKTMQKKRKHRGMSLDIEDNITRAIELKVLKEESGKLYLTPGGREIAEHMQEVIPFFVSKVFSPQSVLIVTISIHVFLTIVKLTLGTISHSAGLFADGIDNGVDTLSSVFVWFGIKFNKEKLVSFLIVIMIFFSVFGIGMASYNKIVNPEPIEDGIVVFIVSAIFGLLMLLLSIYQYFTGRRSSNFAITCQSVDSRNHFLTSLLVCAGIILSLFAERYAASWLYYADAVASIVIGCFIFKSGIELLIELIKPGGKPEHVAHFMQKAQERMRKRMIFDWLSGILKDNSLSLKELEERFKTRFCSQPPKIMSLTGFGYWPERSSDFHKYLEYFIKEKKIVKEKGKYILSSEDL